MNNILRSRENSQGSFRVGGQSVSAQVFILGDSG